MWCSIVPLLESQFAKCSLYTCRSCRSSNTNTMASLQDTKKYGCWVFLLNLNLKMSPSLQITRDPQIPQFYSCTECTFCTLGNPWGPIVSIPTTSTKSRNQTKVYFLKEIEFRSNTLMWYQYNSQYKWNEPAETYIWTTINAKNEPLLNK